MLVPTLGCSLLYIYKVKRTTSTKHQNTAVLSLSHHTSYSTNRATHQVQYRYIYIYTEGLHELVGVAAAVVWCLDRGTYRAGISSEKKQCNPRENNPKEKALREATVLILQKKRTKHFVQESGKSNYLVFILILIYSVIRRVTHRPYFLCRASGIDHSRIKHQKPFTPYPHSSGRVQYC